MRRALAIGALVVVALAAVVFATGAKDDGDGEYLVRAIFDNAGFLVSGEDVKASGVVIGEIHSLDVTPEKKAAVILKITDPAFRDFKVDARCAVRLQSLLGEKYVACEPTQPRNDGDPVAPSLRKIEDGPGEGQYLLPVQNTSSAVDLDQLNNIMRLPQRQRLALIINELGTGLAGNGEELRAVIRRAYPALDESDRVLRILADENRVLAKLAEDSDVALEPLAREQRAISNFIDKAGDTAAATAERGDDLERNFELLPGFLRELRLTMARLGSFSEEASPVLADLRTAAPSVNQIFEQLGPFTTAALPTVRTLGDAAVISRRALLAARPVIQDVRQLADATGPVARDLAVGLTDLEREHGIDRFMQTVLGFTGSLNGFDSVGHYARVQLYIAKCLTPAITVNFGDSQCNRNYNFDFTGEASTAAAEAPPSSGNDASGLSLPRIALPGDEPSAPADGDSPAAPDDGISTDGETAEDPRAGVLGYLLGTEATR